MKKTAGYGLLLFLALSSCFGLRDPEPPATASEWTSPTQPDILIDNFSSAVRNMNVTVYERCFLPEFRFLPDPVTAGTSAGLFDNWSLAEERDYFNSLKTKSPKTAVNQLTLTKTRENYFLQDSLEQFYEYTLKTRISDTAFKIHELGGTMRLILARRNNEWKIAKWEDNKKTNACWSDLKKYCISR